MRYSAFGVDDDRISKAKGDPVTDYQRAVADKAFRAGVKVDFSHSKPAQSAAKKARLVRNLKRGGAVGLAAGAAAGAGAGLAVRSERKGIEAERQRQAAKDKDPLAKSAFGVDDDRISKADGDKDRKVRDYVVAGTAGGTAGGALGGHLGARSAGTDLSTVGRQSVENVKNARTAQVAAGLKPTFKAGRAAAADVPGIKATVKGGKIGAAAGLAGGVGLLANGRRRRNQDLPAY